MFQILMLKNPIKKRGLSMIQRLCYLSSMTFWFFPIPRLIFMLAPLTYIFFDIKIFVSNLDEAIAYTATYIVINLMLQNYLFGTVRWPWISELYEYLQGVFLAKAIVSVIANPRSPSFNVTAKGLTLDNDHLSELAWPFFAIWGALFAGGMMATWRYFFEPGVSNLMVVVGAWNTFNMLIAGAALGSVAERKQPDRHPRLMIARKGVFHVDGLKIPVAIDNVSAGGCALRPLEDSPSLGWKIGETEGRLWVEPMGEVIKDETIPITLKHVTSQKGQPLYGFEFPELKAPEYYVLADLMYADSDALPRFLKSRRVHKNVFAGTWQFIFWGAAEPFRAFSYLRKKAHEDAPASEAAKAPEIPHVETTILRKLITLAASKDSPAPAKPVEPGAKVA